MYVGMLAAADDVGTSSLYVREDITLQQTDGSLKHLVSNICMVSYVLARRSQSILFSNSLHYLLHLT